LKLPKDVVSAYVKQYPQAKRRIPKVVVVLKGSPADGLIVPGDIILSINGQSVGPNLYDMDRIMNQSSSPITLEIYRYGERKTVVVNTYDLQEHKINRLVVSGGATFYQVDDSIRLQTGILPGSVLVTNVQRGGSFYYAPIPNIPETDKILIKINSINHISIKTLGDIVKYFSGLHAETDLSIEYSNFGYYFTYSRTFMFNQSPQITEVTYNPLDGPLMIFDFSAKERDWIKQ
jgi:S1-C subfamily serine protease